MTVKDITPQDVFEKMKNADVFLIDVREKEETEQGYIEGAYLAPLSDFITVINNLDFPSDKKIVFYCAKGGRSQRAAEFCDENILRGRDVFNMGGGIELWNDLGLPTKSG